MKIIVLKGSPHISGTSNTLTNEFIKGAKEAGHEIVEYDLAHGDIIHPCIGCSHCGMNGDCFQKDKGNEIIKEILNADAICFATPVYYFGVSAQLKMMIDRFYSRNGAITSRNLKACFIATAWNNDNVVMSAIEEHMNIIFDYLNFQSKGMVLAKGSGYVEMIPKKYYEEAYNLGKNI